MKGDRAEWVTEVEDSVDSENRRLSCPCGRNNSELAQGTRGRNR